MSDDLIAIVEEYEDVNSAIISRTPIFSSSEFYEVSGIPRVSGAKILHDLEENGIIVVLQRGKGRKASIYTCPSLLAITEGDRL
jgi:hypothetical protein